MATQFNGGVDADWNDAGNWSAGIPTLSDDATIASGCTMDIAGECKTLVINGGITLDCNGFNLEVDQGTLVSGSILCKAGEMSFGSGYLGGSPNPPSTDGEGWGIDNRGVFDGGTGVQTMGTIIGQNAATMTKMTTNVLTIDKRRSSGNFALAIYTGCFFDANGGTIKFTSPDEYARISMDFQDDNITGFNNLIIDNGTGNGSTTYANCDVAGDFTIRSGFFNTYGATNKNLSVSGATYIAYDQVSGAASGIASELRLNAGTHVLGTGNTTDCWVGNWDTGLITCTGATVTMAGKFFHESNAIFQASGGTISAFNWSRASDGYGGTGCGTIISHGDETWGSSDNMETKGIFGSDSTATVNCPQNYGNGQLQKVSGTATPTIIAGGYGAPMEPAGNSTVITTGTRVIYIEQRGTQSEGFDGHFWNLIISGNSTKDIGANQNSTWRVLNDFTIQAGSSFSLEDMGSGVTTAGDTYSIDVSGAFIVEGTFYGNTGATNAPNQHFAAVKVASGGAFYATTGTTTIFKGGAGNPLGEGDFNFFARYGGATLFHHNSGTVVFDTFAAGDASWYFDVTEAPFYNVTFGAGPSSAYDMYMNGKSDAYGMNVDNDLTIGIAGTTKMGTFRSFGRPVVVSGTLKILDPGGSNISRIYTTADSTYDVGNFVLEANTRMQPPSDGMTVRGNWINNGGQFY